MRVRHIDLSHTQFLSIWYMKLNTLSSYTQFKITHTHWWAHLNSGGCLKVNHSTSSWSLREEHDLSFFIFNSLGISIHSNRKRYQVKHIWVHNKNARLFIVVCVCGCIYIRVSYPSHFFTRFSVHSVHYHLYIRLWCAYIHIINLYTYIVYLYMWIYLWFYSLSSSSSSTSSPFSSLSSL